MLNEGLTELKNYKDSFADRLGNIYDSNNKRKNFYLNSSGYLCVSLINKNNKRKTVLVNRIIAETFLEKDSKERFYVNHIDGNKLNNSTDNLEWVTAYENNIHSVLINYETHKFKLVIYKNNIPIKAVSNLKEAEEFIKIDFRLIWNAIKNNKKLGIYHFEYLTNYKSLPKELKEYKTNTGIKKKVLLFDTETNEIKVFDGLILLSRFLGVYQSAIFQAIHDNDFYNGGSKMPKLIKKRYMVAYREKGFPPWTKEQIARAKLRGSKPVFAYNVHTRKKVIYESAAEFIRTNKLSRTVITKLLKANKLKEINGWIFVYFVNNNDFLKIENTIFQLANHKKEFMVI